MLLVCVFNYGGPKVAAHQLGVIWNLASSICRSYWTLCNHYLGVPSNGGQYFLPPNPHFCVRPITPCFVSTYIDVSVGTTLRMW